MNENVAQDQVAATLAAAIIVAKGRECDPSDAVAITRKVRAALYPPRRDLSHLDDAALEAFIHEEIAKIPPDELKRLIGPAEDAAG